MYKKGIDKRINENIKTMIEDLKVKKPDLSTLMMKTLDPENVKNKVNSDLSEILAQKKSNIRKNNSSASHRKVDNSKSIISSYRGTSTDKVRNKSTNKTIHTLKDTIKTSSTHIPPINKEALTPSYMTNPKMNNSNSNIILNQNGVPCYNNIHIYTGVNGLKQNDINLRQYIFNKVNNNKKNLMTKPQNKSVSHVRSNSTIGHN